MMNATRHSAFIISHSAFDIPTYVRILFGMHSNVKQIFSLGHRPYEIVVVDGIIRRGNRCFPAQFDHEAGLLKLSVDVPIEQRAWVVAVAVSDAAFRLWRPIPVIFPNCFEPASPDVFSPPRLGPADDQPDH